MNGKLSRGVAVALVCVAGCLPTLNPVYTESDLVFVPELIGTWRGDDSSATWKFSKADANSYRLIYTDKAGQEAQFTAHVARLDGGLFLDVFPDKPEAPKNAFYQFHVVPIHSIYRLERDGSKLTLFSIDFKWLDDYLETHPDELPFTTAGDRKLVTASTEKLQEFVVQHRERFSGAIELERQGKQRSDSNVKTAP